jgi:hypothetical protein
MGKLEKGSMSDAPKVNSRHARWFNQKERYNGSSSGDNAVDNDFPATEILHMQRDSLVKMKCAKTRGENLLPLVKYFRVLCFFTKHYNKWYPAPEQKFVWNDNAKQAHARVLVRLVKRVGSAYQDVELLEEGDYKPREVYSIKKISDIVYVGNELVEGIF